MPFGNHIPFQVYNCQGIAKGLQDPFPFTNELDSAKGNGS